MGSMDLLERGDQSIVQGFSLQIHQMSAGRESMACVLTRGNGRARRGETKYD